jgi:hypothetical protein
MNLDEAKRVLLGERGAPLGRLVMAAGVLCAPENSSQVSLLELIECLRRGNDLGRITPVNEYAALALYYRTGRKRREGHGLYEDFVTDNDDWLHYLQQHGIK